MTEEDTDEMTVSIEYTPLELTTLLQLLDYLDIAMLQSGMPIGIVSLHRKKLYDGLLAKDVKDGLDAEREKKKQEFGDMFNVDDEEIDFRNRDGFQ